MDTLSVSNVVIVVVSILATLMLLRSFKILRPDDGIEVYQFGKHVGTYCPREFLASLTANEEGSATASQQEKYRQLGIKTSPFDIVFALWPIWTMVRFPTSPVKISLHASDVFTKGTEKLPRVEIGATPAVSIRFLSIRNVILGVGLRDETDLTKKCKITGSGGVNYFDTALAQGIREQTKDAIREGLRKTASEFVWNHGSSPNSIEEKEIVTTKRLWELMTLYELAAPESVLAQSKILKRPPGCNSLAQVEKLTVESFLGSDVLTLDINISQLDLAGDEPTASAAQKAVNQQFVAMQNAAGTKAQGTAEAEVIRSKGAAGADVIRLEGEANANAAKNLQDSLQGADPGTIAGLLLLKGQQNTFIPVGGSIPEILKSIGGKKE